MWLTRKILLIIILLISTGHLSAQDSIVFKKPWIEFHGYIEDMPFSSFGGGADSVSMQNLINNRLNFKFNISKKISARLEIRNRIFWGDIVSSTPYFSKTINQYPGNFNLSKVWVESENFVFQSSIDRMLVQYADSKWDIKIGRQRINWGINNIWNPNDIFNAYNFLDFVYVERPGNDAVRVQHFLKNNSILEFALKPGKEKDQSIAALMYKLNTNKYDLQFLSGVYNTDIVFGSGWAGSIKDAGFKGEISYFHPKQKFTDSTGVISASAMLDYVFKKEWYASFSILFNSNPLPMTDLNFLSFSVTAKNLFPFRYTFYAGVSKPFTPIFSMNASLIYSPENNTLILFPSFAWNIAHNFDADITLQSFFANQGNQYKSQGNILYLRGKWSF